MKVFQSSYQNHAWHPPLPVASDAALVLSFGSHTLMADAGCQQALQTAFPRAENIGCTTSGEIFDTEIYDDTLCVTAITWERSSSKVAVCNVDDHADSETAGARLAETLGHENLRHVLVLSDGQKVNGSALVKGLRESLPKSVSVSGGLAGDDVRFHETWAWHNSRVESGLIVVCGLYGDNLKIGHGCVGGWLAFGPDRLITKARDNILYEVDGTSALELYKTYLGDHAKDLPGSALLFPLHVHKQDEQSGVVRTILNIDEKDQSMIFAGDIEIGDYAQLMHANFDRLIDGAGAAARDAMENAGSDETTLALLVSCVGRRIVLKQRAEEELEAVKEELRGNPALCGFYSYGEISPSRAGASCCLHNQTMTITTFAENLDA